VHLRVEATARQRVIQIPVTVTRNKLARVLTIVVALAPLSSHTGCRRTPTSSTITVEHQITPQPIKVGPAVVLLKVADNGQPVSAARVTLEANMTHAGMQPEFGEAREIEPGIYQGAIRFTMAGDWLLLVNITTADGATRERTLDVKGVSND
jgi:hypothetical protein